MSEAWYREIHDYFEAMFSAIRKFTENEPGYRDYVPDMFKFPYLVLSFRCLDGYVVAAYPSGIADNYIHIEQDRKIDEVLGSLPNKILNTENHVCLGMRDLGGSGRYEAVFDRVDTNRGPLPTTGWKFLHIATTDHHWKVEEARETARQFISTFKARAALYEVPSGGGFIQHYDRIDHRKEITDRLYGILDVYKSIINEKSYEERIIHRFLRDHRVLFYPGKKRLLYEYPLRDQGKLVHKIDFIVELTTSRYILVELENPKHSIFTKSGDYSASVTHAVGQVEDWVHFLSKNPKSDEKDLPGMVAPEGVIVIGRSNSLDLHQRERIQIRNGLSYIKLYTYDDLAEQAENHIRHILEV